MLDFLIFIEYDRRVAKYFIPCQIVQLYDLGRQKVIFDLEDANVLFATANQCGVRTVDKLETLQLEVAELPGKQLNFAVSEQLLEAVDNDQVSSLQVFSAEGHRTLIFRHIAGFDLHEGRFKCECHFSLIGVPESYQLVHGGSARLQKFAIWGFRHADQGVPGGPQIRDF